MAEQQFDRLLSQKEVVEWTGMSPAYFNQARHRGDTTLAWVKIGRRVLYKTSDVQRWLNNQMIGAGI